MSSVHIYVAKSQPATRHTIVLSDQLRFTVRYRRLQRLPAMCCKRQRIAANLVAHVYYDGTWFYCRKGKGCKQP